MAEAADSDGPARQQAELQERPAGGPGPVAAEWAARGADSADPTTSRRSQGAPRPNLRRMIAFFKPYKAQVGVVLFAILLTSFIGLVNPIPPQADHRRAIPERDLEQLYLYVGLMIVLPILSGLIGVGQATSTPSSASTSCATCGPRSTRHLQQDAAPLLHRDAHRRDPEPAEHDVGGVQSVVTDTATSDRQQRGDRHLHRRRDVAHHRWQMTVAHASLAAVLPRA